MSTALVLGASGFLGREVMRAFPAGVDVKGLSRRGGAGVEAVDIRDPAALAGAVDRVHPDMVLLLAAYREPDFCEDHPDEARRLNTEPARVLARSLPPSVQLVFMSTDYVFDGEHPPYTEESPRSPVSEYGRSKATAEDALMSRPNTIILRSPLLIGGGPTLAESGFIGQMAEAVTSQRRQQLDDVLIRCPTWTRDVAGAIRFLLERGASGVFHFSSLRGRTRYGWTVEMARVMGRPHDHLLPSKTIVQRKAPRPLNSQLASDKIAALGYGPANEFGDVVRAVFAELGVHP